MAVNENTAYCFRCKAMKLVKNPEFKIMKTRMRAISGTCPDCGGKLFKILPKKKKVEENQ